MWKNVAYNQPTSIISCGHLGEVLHRGKCVIHFQSHFQHTKMKEEQYELAHDEQTHSLNSIQKWPAIATQWNGHVFVMGLTSPEHLGRPLTSKVHWSRSSQDAGTNYSAWYDATEKLRNQTYTNWLKPSTRMAPLRANQAQSILGRVKCSVVHASVNFVYLKFFFYTSTLTWW